MTQNSNSDVWVFQGLPKNERLWLDTTKIVIMQCVVKTTTLVQEKLIQRLSFSFDIYSFDER